MHQVHRIGCRGKLDVAASNECNRENLKEINRKEGSRSGDSRALIGGWSESDQSSLKRFELMKNSCVGVYMCSVFLLFVFKK